MANNKETADILDVLVIGSGIAGLSAAVSACDAGARVTILERSTEEEYGGNTRWTEAYFRMKSESEVSDDFEERLAGNAGYNLDPNIVSAMGGAYSDWPSYVKSHGMPDPELIGALSENAGATVQWLKTFGVRFEALPTYFVTAAAPRLMPVGGGLARRIDGNAPRLSISVTQSKEFRSAPSRPHQRKSCCRAVLPVTTLI